MKQPPSVAIGTFIQMMAYNRLSGAGAYPPPAARNLEGLPDHSAAYS
ncbi:hypothetical protein MuYL_4662 [Mucilaginibacter xinganensis]|uniref:Uncharacterized protein n=1 Tax=Mucilaginibacter xinganensis TaxID=1234841 RepID=A0A223P356_9SPHI|nr:hypothetical protein MuYL_4662 [Mucilaginibacter xinganensis]